MGKIPQLKDIDWLNGLKKQDLTTWCLQVTQFRFMDIQRMKGKDEKRYSMKMVTKREMGCHIYSRLNSMLVKHCHKGEDYKLKKKQSIHQEDLTITNI